MFFKEKKAPLLIALAIVLIMQVIFSGSKATDTIVAEGEPVGSETTSNVGDSELAYTDEVVNASLHVVYKSSVAAIDDSNEKETEGQAYYNKIISFTCEKLYVYAEPKLSSAVVGVMYSGTEGDILEAGPKWTKIRSGKVEGYVNNVAVLFGEEAEKMATMIGKITVSMNQEGVSLREKPYEDSNVIAELSKASDIDIQEAFGDYLLVLADGEFGYVPKDTVTVSYGIRTAITIEEYNKIKAEEAAAAAAAAAEAKKKAEAAAAAAALSSGKQLVNVPITQRTPYNATPEELHLLAAIIYREANNQPFEGKLAVANVVLNRVFNKRFKQNTITSVIYAPNQFAGTGANGVPSAAFLKYYNMTNEQLNKKGCYDAAVQACQGKNNIGDLCYYIAPWSKIYSKIIAKSTHYYVISGHTFYTMY